MNKRVFTVMIALVLSALMSVGYGQESVWKGTTIAEAIANVGGGDGSSEDDAIRIASAAELTYLAKQANAGGTSLQLTNGGPLHTGNEAYFKGTFFKLADNINLDSWTTSIGTSVTFAGTFDGNGYVITMTNATVSLFGTINKGGTVKNLGVNATISAGDEKAGGIAANNKGMIQRCYVEGSITSTVTYSSGIADNGGIIEDCYSTVSVTITGKGYYAGGIAGGNYKGTIQRCYATGAISSQGSAGIAGAGSSTNSVQNCIALNESITGTGSIRARVANGSGTLTDNYASPAIVAIAGTWENIGADKKDGADLTAANFIGKGAGAFTAWSGDIWDFGDNTNLPTLKGFKADQPVKGITRKSVIPAITTIATAEDLATFRDAMNNDGETYKGKTVTLAADITVSDWDTPISDDDDYYKNGIFKGTFDGQGHVITLTGSASLFGQIGEEGDKVGTVQNLGVKTTITANEYSNAGGIVNSNYGTIQHCYTAGTINAENAENAGGIAMFNYNLIQDCYSTTTVTGDQGGSGIASENSGTIQRCYATGAVKGDVVYGTAAGGIAGMNKPGSKVESCIALNTSIEGPNGGLGRIVGFNNSGTLTGNYASPLIAGTWRNIDADKQDGADLTDANFIDTGAGASAFDGWQTAVWDFSNADNLPTLKGFKGDQPVKGITRASVMPESLITTIATAADLAAFRDAVNSGKTYEGKTVTLTADITLAGDWTPIGTSSNQFKGTFEGGGHCISGLSVTISEGGFQYGGLFNTIGEKGIVQDLGVKGTVSVTSKDDSAFAGGITGYNYGTIQHCYTNVTVTASTGDTQYSSDHAGGIAGINSNKISCCYTMGNSTAILNAGGIAGTNMKTIEQCYATGAVEATNTSAGSAGGIVGNSFNGSSNRMCIALNSSITGGSSSGRIGNGNGSFDYNYASPAIAGTWKNTGADKQDGADLTAANFIDTGAVEGAFNGWLPAVWDFSDADKLPQLKTTGLTPNIVIAGQADPMPARADFLEKSIEISTVVEYDADTHKDKNIVVKQDGTFTVTADNASLKKLTIEEGGQVNTINELKVTEGLTTARTLANQWITFGTPLALNTKYTVPGGSMYCVTGYSEVTNDQCWTNKGSIPATLTADTPYLLAAEDAGTALTLTTGSPVTIPAFKDAETGGTLNTGIFLFRMNPALCNQPMTNIYVLSNDGYRFELHETAYTVKPFECYLIANKITTNAIKSLRISGDLPTGNLPVLPSDTFRIWGTDGQLHLDATVPADVTICDTAGRILHRFHLDGSRTLTLGRGIYLIRTNNITYKVSL